MASFKVNSMLAVTIILWSSAFVGIRIGLTAFTPGSLALYRFIIASVCMFFIYHQLPNQRKITWPDRLQLIVLGMIGIGVYNICLNYGELSVSAGVASFIIGLMPVITLLLSIIFLKERPSLPTYLGIITSLLGLLIIALAENTHASMGHGMLIILLSALSGAVFTVMLRRFLSHYHPVAVSAWTMWGGMLLLLIFAPTLWREMWMAPIPATMAAIYMGIFPAALAYLTWSYVLNVLPASKATLYLYILPLISTLLGFLLLHERPSRVSLAGGFIALSGALFASRYRSQKSPFLSKSADKEAAMG